MPRQRLTTLSIGTVFLAALVGGTGAGANEFYGMDNPTTNPAAAAVFPTGRPIDVSGAVPGAPTRPVAGSRPESWPTGESAVEPLAPPPSMPLGETKPCEDARILARVGTEVILAGEVMALVVRDIFDPATGIHAKPPREPSPLAKNAWEKLNRPRGPAMDNYRVVLLRDGVNSAVEMKLIYLDARRKIPAENLDSVDKQLEQAFEASELPQLLAANGFNSRREFEEELRRLGSSLEWQKQIFKERSLAQQVGVRGTVNFDETVPHEKLLAHYQEHLAEYEHPSRVRWEQITVRVSKYPSKAAAYDALAKMGNLVKDGAAFAEIARRGSDGVTASKGGARDWTTQGSLVSKTLDQAIFALPVGQLSPILEDEQGFHIVRVAERKEAYRTPFNEAQAQIEETIRRERIRTQLTAYLARLRAETPASTVFDSPSGRADAPNTSVARRRTEQGPERR